MLESCASLRRKEVKWKDYMERIMNEEHDWDYNVKIDAVEGPVVHARRKEVLQALNETKTENAPGPSETSLQLIAASRGVGIQ